MPATATSEPAASGYRLAGEDDRIRADRVAVQDAIGAPGTTLADVRAAAEYPGGLLLARWNASKAAETPRRVIAEDLPGGPALLTSIRVTAA
jgi:hypothetical protein